MDALRAVIRPGAVVMDIGTGPGIMAVQACQLGAKHVYAIEPGEVIQVAREIAAANHFADKIEFFEDVSTNVTIPVRADVIVSDLRGVLPLYSDHIPSIADARRRFLAPGGTLIGREDRVWAAVVDAPERYSKIVGPWTRDLPGQDLSPARQKVVNEIHKMQAAPEQLLTSPNLWVALDYMRIENPDVQGELTWTVKRDGTGHGIVIWFDADLADGVGFSNRPGSGTVIYGSLFLPWPEPVSLVAGQGEAVEQLLLEGSEDDLDGAEDQLGSTGSQRGAPTPRSSVRVAYQAISPAASAAKRTFRIFAANPAASTDIVPKSGARSSG